MSRLKYVRIRTASSIGVAERWRSQYQHPKDGWTKTVTGNSGAIYDKLCALGPKPSAQEVADVIGNKSWSFVACDGCTEYIERAAEIGEYEPKAYCEMCLREALQSLTGAS
jgi:hypothetical protein